MQHFKWTKANAVFLPEIDAEHRNVIRLAEELQQALAAGAESARVQTLLESLVAVIEEHFSHEEQLMKAAACASYQWHRQQHDTARKQAKHFVALVRKGDAEAPAEFLEFLRHWLKDHMGLTDVMMGAQLRNRGRLLAVAS